MDSPTSLPIATEQVSVAKKEYETPQIVYQSLLESMAGQCGVQPPGKADELCSVTSS